MTTPRPPVGQSRHRLEDPQFVRGAARYVGDLPLDGVLTVCFVRCPLGHAKIKRRSFDRARGMPGVIAVFGPDDLDPLGKPIPPMGVEKGIQQRPPSPLTDEARFAGDAVAIVVADDPYRAADAADAVEIDYDELPVVLDAGPRWRTAPRWSMTTCRTTASRICHSRRAISTVPSARPMS